VAAVALVIVVVLVALGVHSCQVSQRNSALKDYANNVSSLIHDSAATSSQFFSVLASANGGAAVASVQNQIDEARLRADRALGRARSLDVPDEVKGAQQDLVLAVQMRVDGIGNIARDIQPALAGSKQAISSIAAEMARLYASDAVYKDYAAPQIASALHAANITGGAQIAQDQFLPDIRWLTPSFVASQLRVAFQAASGRVAPGLHGHALNSVSVAGTTLQTGSTNTITANPPPTFALNFTDTGQNAESNVVCKVTVAGTGAGGQTVVPQTTAGQTTTCQVPLTTSPPKGNYTVTATIQPVPGEKNTSNNSQSFPVTFQ
jgi:hypothetical protein